MWYAVLSASANADGDTQDPPSSFGGAGGLSDERPPLDASDGELDCYCERLYNRSLDIFIAMMASNRKPTRRRRLSDYTKRNCEEASAGRRA